MANHKQLIIELTEARYLDLCRIAGDCHLLPADAAEAILNLFLVKIMIQREETMYAP